MPSGAASVGAPPPSVKANPVQGFQNWKECGSKSGLWSRGRHSAAACGPGVFPPTVPMRKTPKRAFSVLVERGEEGCFVARVPGLPGCHTQARLLDKLIERIRETIELCLEVAREVRAAHRVHRRAAGDGLSRPRLPRRDGGRKVWERVSRRPPNHLPPPDAGVAFGFTTGHPRPAAGDPRREGWQTPGLSGGDVAAKLLTACLLAVPVEEGIARRNAVPVENEAAGRNAQSWGWCHVPWAATGSGG